MSRRRWILSLLVVTGCQVSRGPEVVSSDDIDLKVPAIQRDVARRDTKDVAQMVTDLSSDDSAVRFYTIEGLRRLTGEDFGYHFEYDDEGRAPAVARWKRWLAGRSE